MISYREKKEIKKQNKLLENKIIGMGEQNKLLENKIIDMGEQNKLLENKILGIVSQKQEVKNSNLELRKLIALQNKQISAQNERLQKLETIALAKFHPLEKKGTENEKLLNRDDKNIVISFLQRFKLFSNLSAYLK